MGDGWCVWVGREVVWQWIGREVGWGRERPGGRDEEEEEEEEEEGAGRGKKVW